MDLLQPSERRTGCPYKGMAEYWHLNLGAECFEDLAWSYPAPVAEAARIQDYLCFFDERVEAVFVAGEKMARPVTKWSPK